MQESDLLKKIAQTRQQTQLKTGNQLVNYQSIEALSKQLDLNKSGVQDWQQLFTWVAQYLEYSPDITFPEGLTVENFTMVWFYGILNR